MSHGIVLIDPIPKVVSLSETEYLIKKAIWHSDRLTGEGLEWIKRDEQ